MNIGTNAVVSWYALVTASNKSSYSETPVASGVEAYIEQVDPKEAAIFGDNLTFKSFRMILDGTPNILETHKVVDDEGDTYVVYGVQKLGKNTDVPNQTEVTMEKST